MQIEKLKRPVQLRQKLERTPEKAASAFFGGREVFEELAVEAGSGGADLDAVHGLHAHIRSHAYWGSNSAQYAS